MRTASIALQVALRPPTRGRRPVCIQLDLLKRGTPTSYGHSNGENVKSPMDSGGSLSDKAK